MVGVRVVVLVVVVVLMAVVQPRVIVVVIVAAIKAAVASSSVSGVMCCESVESRDNAMLITPTTVLQFAPERIEFMAQKVGAHAKLNALCVQLQRRDICVRLAPFVV